MFDPDVLRACKPGTDKERWASDLSKLPIVRKVKAYQGDKPLYLNVKKGILWENPKVKYDDFLCAGIDNRLLYAKTF